MKKIIYILQLCSTLALMACQERKLAETDQKDSLRYEIMRKENANFDVNGTWGLTNYFDSILAHRALAKFRLQTPTWDAVVLEIKNDSLKSLGSINYASYVIDKTNDTLSTLTSDVTGEKWYLIANDPELRLVQDPHSERSDTTIYIFRKRDDLSHLTSEVKNFDQNVTRYFNENLFVGKYINKETGQLVVFDSAGRLAGIDGFDSYRVRNYFGTLHPHKNLDVITFFNSTTNAEQQYNWIFSGRELILTEFVYETITTDGKTYQGDNMILGKRKLTLKVE